MQTCDVIIPVYNAPDYTKMCIYALFKNTKKETLNKVYLLDDNSNELTRNLLDNLAKKYKDKIVLVHNKENLGFIKNVNQGIQMSTSAYVLLLNTDCFIGKHTIEKMIEQMSQNKKIGLMCPLCSNAANLTLPMFPGYNYMMMDQLLNEKFRGMNFDACTVVGNCLMISRDCIKKVGLFDEIYGMGYGDETDYQFKAMEKGFEAKVAIDSYVFHKAEMSFNTTNKSRQERLEKNRKIFFERWEKQYNELLKEYEKNDPIEYVKQHLVQEDKEMEFDFVFVMDGIGSGVGGASMVISLVNYLSILGLRIGILNLRENQYQGIMNFELLNLNHIPHLKSKYLISTIFRSVFFTKKLANLIGAEVIYFAQGYEFLFENGIFYDEVEASFKLVDYVITISDYLKNEYKELFGIEAIKIENGIDTDQMLIPRIPHHRKSILMVLRPEVLKGRAFMLDILKHLTIRCSNIDIHVVINDGSSSLCVNNNSTIQLFQYQGPISKIQMEELMRKTDILIDTSLNEGFGLVPLEAMALGVVPVVANAFGNLTYCCDKKNAIVISDVNNTHSYIEAVMTLLEDEQLWEKYSKEAIKTAKKYDFDDVIDQYYSFFSNVLNHQYKSIKENITPTDFENLSKYIYSDETFDKKIKMYQKEKDTETKISQKKTRFQKMKIIIKEFIKANVYLLKLLVKTILNKDFDI